MAQTQQGNMYAQSNVWSSRITQCDPPGTGSDWCLSFVFCPCTAAAAKYAVDRTNPIYDCLCWNPVASLAYVRHEYGITGPCGDDCGYGIFCGPCSVRQMYTETRLRGPSPKPWAALYGQNIDQWQRSLFDCTTCGFLKALVCPCCAAADVRDILQPSAAGDDCFNVFCLNPLSMYGQVRSHYGILADCPLAEDLFVPIVCCPCSINRARVEAIHRKDMAMKFLAQQQAAQNQNPGGLLGFLRR